MKRNQLAWKSVQLETTLMQVTITSAKLVNTHANDVRIVQTNVIHVYRLLPRPGLSWTPVLVRANVQFKPTLKKRQGHARLVLAIAIDVIHKMCVRRASQDFTSTQPQESQSSIHRAMLSAWRRVQLHQFNMSLWILKHAKNAQVLATPVRELLKRAHHARKVTISWQISAKNPVQVGTSSTRTMNAIEQMRLFCRSLLCLLLFCS